MKPLSCARGLRLGTLLVTYAGASLAQSNPQAEKLFQDGIRLNKEGKTTEACKSFEASQQLEPSSGTMMNVSECHVAAGKIATAWVEFQTAATLAAKEGKKEREKAARARMNELQAQLLFLKIEVNSPVKDQEVTLDGAKMPELTWGQELPLDPGDHQIGSGAPGYKPFKKTISLTGNGKSSVQIPALEKVPAELEIKPPPVPTKPTGPSPSIEPGTHQDGAGSSTAGWILVGTGGAALVAGGVFGFLALGAESERKDALACSQEPTSCSPIKLPRAWRTESDDAESRGKTMQTVAIISAGVGAVAVGVGLYLVLSGGNEKPKAAAWVRPTFGVREIGLTGGF